MVLNINGVKHEVTVEPDVELLSVLRNNLELTGSKYGCGEGVCGACTVLVNGRPLRSCITPVSSVVGKDIITIEGLEKKWKPSPGTGSFSQSRSFSMCLLCIRHDHVSGSPP